MPRRPPKGFCLHVMSREDILQTYQARTAVEGFCAMQLALNRHTPGGQATLWAMEESVTSPVIYEDFMGAVSRRGRA